MKSLPFKSVQPFLVMFVMINISALLTSCASENDSLPGNNVAITHIQVQIDGATSKSRPNMAVICKGFLLSQNQVRNFFLYSSHAREIHSYDNYNILPCYAKGTALIDKKPYTWIIRSGGVGEFFNTKHHMVKICGQGCCGKVAGVC